ncbi:hypothetical protein GJ496_000751 [Pomphorhynchus laevis]|nr:hypothetical protein GJ496_000751 [Pomphorhynchus laevis]
MLMWPREIHTKPLLTFYLSSVKLANEVFAIHLLRRSQKSSECLDEYLQALKMLANDCNFRDTNAIEIRDQYTCDAFIKGLSIFSIRQRFLENGILELSTAFCQARSLDMALKQAEISEQSHQDSTVSYSLNAVNSEISEAAGPEHSESPILDTNSHTTAWHQHSAVSFAQAKAISEANVQQEIVYVANAIRKSILHDHVSLVKWHSGILRPQ